MGEPQIFTKWKLELFLEPEIHLFKFCFIFHYSIEMGKYIFKILLVSCNKYHKMCSGVMLFLNIQLLMGHMLRNPDNLCFCRNMLVFHIFWYLQVLYLPLLFISWLEIQVSKSTFTLYLRCIFK